jgi:hypothetical protein
MKDKENIILELSDKLENANTVIKFQKNKINELNLTNIRNIECKRNKILELKA